jgi:hypothetical protein
LDRIFLQSSGKALTNQFLDFNRASDGVHGAGELYQFAIAYELNNSARMSGYRWIDRIAPQGLQSRQRTGLVDAHQARVPDHIGCQDCREPPL